MAERKTDYFGSFLDAMKEGREADAGAADPANQVLRALRAGERSMKDLVGLTKNSLSNLIDVVQNLEKLGLVARNNDTLRLTDKGREYALAVG